MTREEFHAALSRDGELTEAALKDALRSREMPPLLAESMAYSLFAGGKRLRPALCLESCAMLSGDRSAALPAACAMEMIHTYSLIHDDLPAMDDDELRRGKPSNHVRFGEGNAILAGDGLLSLAFETLANGCCAQAISAAARGAFDMVAGQSLDLSAAGAGGETELYRIHRLKTGALIRASVLSGAYCAAPNREDVAALDAFANAYGLLFQITDDILDAEGDAALVGKSLGKDAAEDKLTFVSCFGLSGARRKAEEAAASAVAALERFGNAAEFLMELIGYTLTRRA